MIILIQFNPKLNSDVLQRHTKINKQKQDFVADILFFSLSQAKSLKFHFSIHENTAVFSDFNFDIRLEYLMSFMLFESLFHRLNKQLTKLLSVSSLFDTKYKYPLKAYSSCVLVIYISHNMSHKMLHNISHNITETIKKEN